MKQREYTYIDRYLKKEALRKGIVVKEVNMPVNSFAALFKKHVAPFLSLDVVFQVVEKALAACNSLYQDEDGIIRVKVQDSNMPGLVDNKFDEVNAYLLSEINKSKPLNEREQSVTIQNLCFFIEDLAQEPVLSKTNAS